MHLKYAEPRFVWLPLTPRGVAAYTRAGFGKLFAVQFFVALVSGIVVLWFCEEAWFPVLRQAIRALPAQGEIRDGTLHWEETSPVTLASSHFLSFIVNLEGVTGLGDPAQARIEFSATAVKFCSLFGCVTGPYSREWTVAFNRTELEPWWGARESFIHVGLVGVTGATVWLTWQLLSLLYLVPVWIAGFLSNRELTLSGAWRVAGAALLPGAIVMLITIVLYGLGVLDVIRLLFGVALHWAVGWCYLAGGIAFLPRDSNSASVRKNPFDSGARGKRGNPFQ